VEKIMGKDERKKVILSILTSYAFFGFVFVLPILLLVIRLGFLPRILRNTLFFLPQYLLPFANVYMQNKTYSAPIVIFAQKHPYMLPFIYWNMLIILFSYFTRNLRLLLKIIIGLTVFTLGTFVIQIVLSSMGIEIMFDGP
jgi:hypothetical protein